MLEDYELLDLLTIEDLEKIEDNEKEYILIEACCTNTMSWAYIAFSKDLENLSKEAQELSNYYMIFEMFELENLLDKYEVRYNLAYEKRCADRLDAYLEDVK